MCGFVGVAGGAGLVDDVVLARMRDTLCHRGPDAEGLWRAPNGAVALGHRRLSIIDLSAAAAQPMADGSGQLHIVYNGELYNYRELGRELVARGHVLRTASDTEVVLEAYRAWGTACLDRFVGMFAFALWDAGARRLFMARDRAGEKPFFYRHADGVFSCASELKALLAQPGASRVLDRESLELYLTCGFVPADRCMLTGYSKLPAAHALTFEPDQDELRRWRYWDLPEARPDGTSADALARELEVLLEQSVRGQLIATDVPVGVMLSGGLDSSLVTALAARVSAAPVHTFTVTFPGHGRFDESPHARLVASHFGTRHSEIVAAPATVDLLPRLAAQFDEPLADSSMVPTYLVSRAIRASATVALGGDGGDELFGGYQPYRWIVQQEAVRRFVPRALQRAGRAVGDRLAPPGTRGRNYLLGYTTELAERIAHLRVFFDRPGRARLLGRSTGDPERYLGGVVNGGATPVQRLTRTDFLTYLPDDLLVKVDRAAMLASLEVRAPLLDHRIVEFAFARVPDRLKVTATARKVLLRHLARRLLPAEFDTSRKRGFSVPLASWFRGSWGGFFADVLSQAPHDLFDPGEVRQLLEAQRRGRAHMHRLFALTMFELWRRAYRVTS